MDNFKIKTILTVILMMGLTTVTTFSQNKNKYKDFIKEAAENVRQQKNIPNPGTLNHQGQLVERLSAAKIAAEKRQKFFDQLKEDLKKRQITNTLILERNKKIMWQSFCLKANKEFDSNRAELGVAYTRMAITLNRPDEVGFRKHDLPFCALYRNALLSCAFYFKQINEVDSTQHYLRMAAMIPGDEMEQRKIHAMLSEMAFENKDFDGCVEEYEKSKRTLLTSTQGYGVAYSYSAMGDFKNAVATMLNFSYLFPDSVCLYFNPLADYSDSDSLYIQLIDSTAEFILSESEKLYTPEILALGVIRMYLNDRIKDALRLYHPILYDNGMDWNFLMHIVAGDSYRLSGDNEQALECLDRAVAVYNTMIDNKDSTLMKLELMIRGLTYFEMCSYDEAYNSLRHVPFAMVDSNHYSIMFCINYLFNDFGSASLYLEQFFDSTSSTHLLFKGCCLLNTDKKDGETYLRHVIEMEKDSVVKENTPWAYLLLGENRKAKKTMKRNMSISRTLTSVDYIDASEFYLKIGKYNKAKHCLKSAACLNPDKSDINIWRNIFSSTELETYYNNLFQND